MRVRFEYIVPSRIRDKDMRLGLLNAMRRECTLIKDDFRATTRTWKRKPRFEQKISLIGGPNVEVFTTDPIYALVNDGSPPHMIPRIVRPGRTITFLSEYKAKTIPRVLDSFTGGSSGKFVSAWYVNHPGFEARDFEDTVYMKWKYKFADDMRAEMENIARISGHGR